MSKNKLKSSVVIPYYNAGKYIDETMKSVLGQIRLPDEVIIVNDGSTDELSLQKIKQWESDELVTVINQENAGVGATLTNGAKQANGDVIFEVDSDDILGRTYIEEFMRVFENDEGIEGVTCGYDLFFDGVDWENDKNIHRQYMPSGLEIPRVFFENCAGGQNSAFRKTALEKIGYWDKRFSTAQDWGIWLQFLEKELKQYIIKEYLYYYRVRKGSLLQSGSKDYDLDKNLAISMSLVLYDDASYFTAEDYDREKQKFKKKQKIIPKEDRKIQNNFSGNRLKQLYQEFILCAHREGWKSSLKRAKNYLKYGVGKK
jgi:glycosyltransferase involved in cell wall biosynthesis